MGLPPGGRRADDWRRTWLTPRALGLHATVLIVVPVFLALFLWQVRRVQEGNTLSWAYVFEWPFFTGYAIYLWWRLVHDQPRLNEQETRVDTAEVSADGSHRDAVEPTLEQRQADEELAAYNRYLAELAAHDAERGRR